MPSRCSAALVVVALVLSSHASHAWLPRALVSHPLVNTPIACSRHVLQSSEGGPRQRLLRQLPPRTNSPPAPHQDTLRRVKIRCVSCAVFGCIAATVPLQLLVLKLLLLPSPLPVHRCRRCRCCQLMPVRSEQIPHCSRQMQMQHMAAHNTVHAYLESAKG